MFCWICREECLKTNLCMCNNDFSYCHKNCLKKWINISNKNKCNMCNTYYKFPLYFILYNFFLNFINNFIDFYSIICQYNLETGLRWDEQFDE